MPLIKPQAQSGFLSQATQVQAQGAWYAGNLVRWRYGYLEKMAGWLRLYINPFLSFIRRMHAWSDLGNNNNLLVGTDLGLQILVNSTQYTLGPQTSVPGGLLPTVGPTGAISFSVTSGSNTVTVNYNGAVVIGQNFVFTLPISIGGQIIPAGSAFTVSSVVPATSFTFNMPNAAIVTETNTYGVPLLTNDVVNKITVTWNAHGLAIGNSLVFAQSTVLQVGMPGTWEKVNFTAPAGTVVIVDSVPNANHFTFPMGTLGTGDGAGGTTHQVYEGSSIQNNTGGALVTSLGNVIGISGLSPLPNPQQDTWYLTNFGEDGLVLQTGGPLKVYLPPITNGANVSIVGPGPPATAPQVSSGMFMTMPQAQVVLFGTEAIMGTGDVDPLLVRFSDAGTYDVWSATVSNQAGSYRLSRGSKIIAGIQAPQTTLLLTDRDLWSMSYIGPPLVYGFTVMGTGCGVIAPHAVVTLGKTTYWLSLKGVWQVGDSGVQLLPCSVWDFIFENLDTINMRKCHAAANQTTNEIAFYFPPKSTELQLQQLQQNLLVDSQDFAAAAWLKSGASALAVVQFATGYVYEPQYLPIGWFDDEGLPTISWLDRDIQAKPQSQPNVFAPDGTLTTTTLFELTNNGLHQIYQQDILKFTEKQIFTFSLYVHKSSTRNITLRAGNQSGSVFVTFDVVNGVYLTSGSSAPWTLQSWGEATDAFATGLDPTFGNGWLRYYIVFQTDDADSFNVYINLTNGKTLSYLGSNGFARIWGAQLNAGGQLLDYTQTGDTLPQNETTFYIKYNVSEGAWDSGVLMRTAWIDVSILGTPLGADASFLVQQHERGFDADDQPMDGVFVESGFTELGDGTQMMSVHQCQPDFKWFGNNGEVKIRLKTRNYPADADRVYGPFSATPTTRFFNPRARGRYVAVRYDWSPIPGFSARVGVPTYKVVPTGRRP